MGSYPLKTMRKLRKQFKPLVLKEAIVIHLIQESQFMFLGHKPKKTGSELGKEILMTDIFSFKI